jgi:hypothetical protein
VPWKIVAGKFNYIGTYDMKLVAHTLATFSTNILLLDFDFLDLYGLDQSYAKLE